MGNTVNLNLNPNVITFDFGVFKIDYQPSDEKEIAIQEKSVNLKEKADSFEADVDNFSEREARQEIKELIDDAMTVTFDETVPERLYDAVGKNALDYLAAAIQIFDAITQERQKKLNDKAFKKYLSD